MSEFEKLKHLALGMGLIQLILFFMGWLSKL